MIVTMARDTAPAQPPRARQCPPFECVALTLQGGGALGGYQAGVYQALDEAQVRPDWVAGISIGAINAAIIVRNRPEARVARLREFWTTVSAEPIWGGLADYSGHLSLKCCAKNWFMPGYMLRPPSAYRSIQSPHRQRRA